MNLKSDIIHFGFIASCSYRMAKPTTHTGICYFICRPVTVIKIIITSIFNRQKLSKSVFLKDANEYNCFYFSRLAVRKGILVETNVEPDASLQNSNTKPSKHNTDTIQKTLDSSPLKTEDEDIVSNTNSKCSGKKKRPSIPQKPTKRNNKYVYDRSTQTTSTYKNNCHVISILNNSLSSLTSCLDNENTTSHDNNNEIPPDTHKDTSSLTYLINQKRNTLHKITKEEKTYSSNNILDQLLKTDPFNKYINVSKNQAHTDESSDFNSSDWDN